MKKHKEGSNIHCFLQISNMVTKSFAITVEIQDCSHVLRTQLRALATLWSLHHHPAPVIHSLLSTPEALLWLYTCAVQYGGHSHMWLFVFKLKLEKIKNSVPQSHEPRLKFTSQMRLVAPILESAYPCHLHQCREFHGQRCSLLEISKLFLSRARQ